MNYFMEHSQSSPSIPPVNNYGNTYTGMSLENKQSATVYTLDINPPSSNMSNDTLKPIIPPFLPPPSFALDTVGSTRKPVSARGPGSSSSVITADRIWELRKQGDITPEMLVTIPHIRMDVVHQFIDYTTLGDFKFVDHVEDDLEDFADKCSIFSGEEQNEDGEEEETKCPNLQTIIEKSESLIPPKAFSFQYPQMQLGQESQEKKIKFDLVQNPVTAGKVLDSVPKSEQVAPRSYSSPVDRHEIKPTLSFRPKAVSTGIAQRKRKVGQSVMRPVAPPQFTPQLQTMLPGSVSAGSNVFSAQNMAGMPSTVWSTRRRAPTGTYCYNAQPIIKAAPTMTTFQQPIWLWNRQSIS
ncbi:Hypothetical predicted protein [Mytilus galloprovincialis]|uniref:Uncharacterized protein n=1 Tax=Mytilus galloprovincialis TaxID=29158 RepID=A0A8B6CEV6_MYTGA|nr:Hypothetical predicted protein [Mytilus galloprovincialis]